MDLSYGPAYEKLREEVRGFLAESWPPTESQGQGSDERHFRTLATERGYLYRSIPRRYGGSEQPSDALAAQVIREEFGRARAPTEARGVGTMMLVPTLLEKGEEWQKQRFIAPTLSGEIVWCQGYSEPGSGSDLASLQTRAELVDGEWVIHGQKIWTSNAHRADNMFCLARTEPGVSKHAGISYLLIDMKQPGIEVRPLRQITGASHFNEVFFDGAKTPDSWIVGKRGEGWSVSRATLKHERNSIGGAAQTSANLAAITELAAASLVAGAPALDDPEVRQRLVEIEGYVKSHLYSSYWQLTRESQGREAGMLPLLNKIISTNIGSDIARLGLDLVGDGGLAGPEARSAQWGKLGTSGADWVFQYMQSLGSAIAGGTANIQRNIVAERGLGLPRDAAASQKH